jgi:hypothetical protein
MKVGFFVSLSYWFKIESEDKHNMKKFAEYSSLNLSEVNKKMLQVGKKKIFSTKHSNSRRRTNVCIL